MKLRPRYVKYVSQDEAEVKNLLIDQLELKKDKFRYEVYDSYILVKYRPELHKIWTPQINITFWKNEAETKVRGSIGPSGEIWLAFMFFYSLFALLFVGTLFYGLSQFTLGHPSTLFLSLSIVSLLALGAMYLISYLGQSKSKDQITYLYEWMEGTLE